MAAMFQRNRRPSKKGVAPPRIRPPERSTLYCYEPEVHSPPDIRIGPAFRDRSA